MDNLSGNSIKGYELRERIGAGGFGAVYKAYQSTVGREVAMKIILPHFASHPDFIRRFESEAQLVARLEHPYIVPLYDYWRDPDGAYLVMRWLRGGSLHEALKSGPFDLEAASLLLDQVTAGLAVAHRNSVIHRDLKPGNILLDEDGNAYLADFGIAKDVSLAKGITEVDAVVGSPDYLAPEQARSEQVTPCTDIYSLGVVLYEILTGQHPFASVSLVERLYKHLNEPLPFITTLTDEVAGEVNEVIQKATTKNPTQRFTDVLEMAAAFRAAVRRPTSENVVESLSQREQEILQRIVEGKSNKAIAQELYLSIITVKWYITQIYRKLRVRSRMQAMVRARDLNLLGSGAGAPISVAAVPTEDYHPENPYKGLRAFQLADSADFFGREKMVQKLVQKLTLTPGPSPSGRGEIQRAKFSPRDDSGEAIHESPLQTDDNGRFLAVVGPSGSGKSSLVKAGLIPALLRGDLPGSERWFIVEMLPGAHPLDELEVALTRVAANQAGSLHEHLVRDERGLLRAAGLILPNDGSELVLVIDQFEEVFTLVEDEPLRQHFLNLILTAVTDTRSRVRVVLTLRADFYDRPLQYPDFGELVRSRMETILPLTAEGLERAIAKPAERVGARFEEGVVAKIVGEVNYQPGALPLLQYALTELFERRQGRMLTHEAYLAVGGTIGALAKRADELYENLSESGKEAAKQMFLRLVTLGEGTEDTRRRVPRSELLALVNPHPPAPSPSGRRGENGGSLEVPLHEGEGFRVRVEDDMDELIDTYAGYRLLSLDNDPSTRAPTVEVAHEAILREWERLRAWLNDSRDDIKLQRQLSHAADEWKAAKQDTSFLVTGSRLEMFERWAGETQLALTPLERDFLQGSLEERTHQAAAEESRQAREQRLERRSILFLRGLVAVLLLATLGAFALTGVAVNQSNIANRNAELSQSLALASAAQAALTEGNTDQAVALAIAANQIDTPPVFAQRMLYESAFAPGTIRRIPCATQWCWGMDVSPDEQTVLTSDVTGRIVLSDIITGQPIRTFEGGHTDEIQEIAFLPDGDHFLSTGVDDRMVLWDVASGQVVRRYENPSGDLMAIAISPDGRLAATASEGGEPIIWDIETGEIVHQLVGHDPSVQSQGVAFSPDGRTLLSGSEDTTMILWDVQTGELLRRFEGHTNVVFTVHFSPDGGSALSTSFDNTMILWDIATGQAMRQFTGHTSWVFDAHFSPDGTRILSASRDQTIILWDVATGNRLHTYVGEAGAALQLKLLANGTQAISTHNTGYMRLWQLEANEIVRQFGEQAPPADNEGLDDTLNVDGDIFALSSDGQWVAAPGGGADADEILLWDVETGQLLRRFAGHEGNVTSISFSPDQHRLVSAAWDNTLILWDVQSGEQIRRFVGHSAAVFDVSFSPDGRQLLSGSEDRTMILWDVETGEQIRRFEGYTDSVNTVAFSPDGHLLLAGFGTIRYVAGNNEDNRLRLFDAATGEEIRRFEGHTAPVTTAMFSPDGNTILSGSTDATVRLWDVATGRETRRFNNPTTAVWSVDYSPEYVAAGSQDGTIIVWSLTTGELLRQFNGSAAMVYGVDFNLHQEALLSADANGMLHMWRLSFELDTLLTWTRTNRYIPELTCEQRTLYKLEPLCEAEGQVPAA